MDQATRMGAIIMPPIPSFYNRPESIDDMVTQSVARMLDLFDLAGEMVTRWDGTAPAPAKQSGQEYEKRPTPAFSLG
jgi:4-hydroxy-3-polyprenylbenzoate decarboxylase